MRNLIFIFLFFYSCSAPIHTVQYQDTVLLEKKNTHQVSGGVGNIFIHNTFDLNYAYALPHGVRARFKYSLFTTSFSRFENTQSHTLSPGLMYYHKFGKRVISETNLFYKKTFGRFEKNVSSASDGLFQTKFDINALEVYNAFNINIYIKE